ncbi:MAG: hypothetical protein KJ896_03635 [Nanoarchaeota archaeon]|nr:hypothetical protein [Nanoarchaeota archaeon]
MSKLTRGGIAKRVVVIDVVITSILLITIIALVFLNIQSTGVAYLENPDNVVYDINKKILEYDSLTLKQKIAQMFIVYGEEENRLTFQKMMVGGVFFDARPTQFDFERSVYSYQKYSNIPMLITLDLEGCRNPFENFASFPTFSEIETVEEAYQVGVEEGELMKELGFTMNFAPVVDLEDEIWGCRSFPGTPKEIAAKANAYIKGLNESGILAVAKHYPGKTLVNRDLHLESSFVVISEEDLIPFKSVVAENVPAVMVSHAVTTGAVDTFSKPGVVSQPLVSDLKNGLAGKSFTGLVITDEIGMLSLKNHYTDDTGWTNYGLMFTELFNSGNDMILVFDREPARVYEFIEYIEKEVKRGEISEERIDESVIKILEAKGITVV